jgi:hypothetical protein
MSLGILNFLQIILGGKKDTLKVSQYRSLILCLVANTSLALFLFTAFVISCHSILCEHGGFLTHTKSLHLEHDRVSIRIS